MTTNRTKHCSKFDGSVSFIARAKKIKQRREEYHL